MYRNILYAGYILHKLSIPDIAAKTANYTKKGAVAVASFLRHLLDGLLDICSFVLLLFSWIMNSTDVFPDTRLTFIFENFQKVTLDIPEEFYKLIIFCILCTYLLFKGLIVLTAGAKKKILPTLLIVIQILLCFIIQDNNLAFVLAINFLLIYVFQQLCEFSKKSVKIKFIIYFAILALLLLFFFAQGIVATPQAAT